MENNILCNIRHFPLIITKIFDYSLKRPFILPHMIENSDYLKAKMNDFKIDKYNNLPKEVNALYSFYDEIVNFKSLYEKIMNKEIIIEDEEKNYYITKPYINSLFEISDNLYSFSKSRFLYKKKEKNLFAKFLFEFCLYQPYITLSINLFSKDNDKNTINMELTEADLDYNYLKYLNQNQNLNLNRNQKMKFCINIYNKYSILKLKSFGNSTYYNNINLLENLNIEEINFIRANFKEREKIENIIYKKQIIEEINFMFILLQQLKNKNSLTTVNFSDNIIKNISFLYNEKELIKTFDNKNYFINLKNIGISPNLINRNIKSIINNFFNHYFSVVYYQDIIDYINNNNKIINFDKESLYINLENNIIYDINLLKYFSNIFNIKNSQISNKISKIEIMYNCGDINIFFKNIADLNDKLFKEGISKCYLPNLKEIIIKNYTYKVYTKIIKNKVFNFISFICSFSKCINSIIIQDSYIPFNIFDYENININNITNLSIKSPSLKNYSYGEIIEKLNKLINIQFISIDTLSPKFNDTFNDVRISKRLECLKEFTFNDFFEYKNIEKKNIIYKQNCNIDTDLFYIFSEIIENEKNLEKLELNGFLYIFDTIKNKNVKNIEINLEENDKNYKINKIKYQKINLTLQNFPNLHNLYIYVDILETVDNFIQLPINPNLKRIFLFASIIRCDINKFDDLLRKNGVELIVRIFDCYNKGMIMAYIASFPNNN